MNHTPLSIASFGAGIGGLTGMTGGNDDTSWLYGYDAWNKALDHAPALR